MGYIMNKDIQIVCVSVSVCVCVWVCECVCVCKIAVTQVNVQIFNPDEARPAGWDLTERRIRPTSGRMFV